MTPAARKLLTGSVLAGVALCIAGYSAVASAGDMPAMTMSAPAVPADKAALNAEQPFLAGNDAAMATMMAGMAISMAP